MPVRLLSQSLSHQVMQKPLNYRPISLPSVVSKIMERHIYSIVFEHLAVQEFLSAAQCGDLPWEIHSYNSDLVSTFHNILQLMENG